MDTMAMASPAPISISVRMRQSSGVPPRRPERHPGRGQPQKGKSLPPNEPQSTTNVCSTSSQDTSTFSPIPIPHQSSEDEHCPELTIAASTHSSFNISHTPPFPVEHRYLKHIISAKPEAIAEHFEEYNGDQQPIKRLQMSRQGTKQELCATVDPSFSALGRSHIRFPSSDTFGVPTGSGGLKINPYMSNRAASGNIWYDAKEFQSPSTATTETSLFFDRQHSRNASNDTEWSTPAPLRSNDADADLEDPSSESCYEGEEDYKTPIMNTAQHTQPIMKEEVAKIQMETIAVDLPSSPRPCAVNNESLGVSHNSRNASISGNSAATSGIQGLIKEIEDRFATCTPTIPLTQSHSSRMNIASDSTHSPKFRKDHKLERPGINHDSSYQTIGFAAADSENLIRPKKSSNFFGSAEEEAEVSGIGFEEFNTDTNLDLTLTIPSTKEEILDVKVEEVMTIPRQTRSTTVATQTGVTPNGVLEDFEPSGRDVTVGAEKVNIRRSSSIFGSLGRVVRRASVGVGGAANAAIASSSVGSVPTPSSPIYNKSSEVLVTHATPPLWPDLELLETAEFSPPRPRESPARVHSVRMRGKAAGGELDLLDESFHGNGGMTTSVSGTVIPKLMLPLPRSENPSGPKRPTNALRRLSSQLLGGKKDPSGAGHTGKAKEKLSNHAQKEETVVSANSSSNVRGSSYEIGELHGKKGWLSNIRSRLVNLMGGRNHEKPKELTSKGDDDKLEGKRLTWHP